MTSLQTVDTVIKDNIIVLNEGEPGDGVSAIRSGIEVDRGTLDNETFLFSEEGWLGTGGVDPAIDVVLPSWISSTLSLTDDLSAENIYARNSATINGELSVTGNAGIDGDTNIGGNANVTGNVEVTGHITASSDQEHQIGDFTFNQNVMSVVATDMEIRSPGGISFYPDEDNSNPVPQGGEKIVWLRDGAKLVFEGTVPDDYEVKLQATDITDDRDIILPDESGTLALQEWVKRELNYVQFQSIIGDGSTSDYTMNFTVAEDWQALIYIDGVLQEPTTAYTISNGDNLSFAGPIPNTSVVNIIRLANNSHTSDIVSAEDSNKLNNQPGSYYLDYNNFYNIPTNVAAFSNDAFYISVNDGYATEQYVDTKVSDLVNSAPNTLDTLNELATALDNDPHFSTSITNMIATKASTTYVNSEISTAKSEAISTASADATTKADNAQSNAISTAAVDATAKANTAETNANAYTDNAIANIPTGGGSGIPWFDFGEETNVITSTNSIETFTPDASKSWAWVKVTWASTTTSSAYVGDIGVNPALPGLDINGETILGVINMSGTIGNGRETTVLINFDTLKWSNGGTSFANQTTSPITLTLRKTGGVVMNVYVRYV
jgi:hypothetical protein